VRDKLQEAACSLQETFNLQHQTQAHPWAMLGGSVAAGYVLGSLLPDAESIRHDLASAGAALARHEESRSAAASHFAAPGRTEKQSMLSGALGSLVSQFGPEIQKVKGLAIGSAMGLLRDLLKSELPRQLTSDFEQIVDSVTTKL